MNAYIFRQSNSSFYNPNNAFWKPSVYVAGIRSIQHTTPQDRWFSSVRAHQFRQCNVCWTTRRPVRLRLSSQHSAKRVKVNRFPSWFWNLNVFKHVSSQFMKLFKSFDSTLKGYCFIICDWNGLKTQDSDRPWIPASNGSVSSYNCSVRSWANQF